MGDDTGVDGLRVEAGAHGLPSRPGDGSSVTAPGPKLLHKRRRFTPVRAQTHRADHDSNRPAGHIPQALTAIDSIAVSGFRCLQLGATPGPPSSTL